MTIVVAILWMFSLPTEAAILWMWSGNSRGAYQVQTPPHAQLTGNCVGECDYLKIKLCFNSHFIYNLGFPIKLRGWPLHKLTLELIRKVSSGLQAAIHNCFVLSGKSEGNGRMHITLCDFIVPWDSLSATQKKSLNQRYQMGCECKVNPNLFDWFL